MESNSNYTPNITYLTKPKIKPGSLSYIKDQKDIYVNLFEFKMTKPIKLYLYSYTIEPDIGDNQIRAKIAINCGRGKKKE